jgi:hypothetical protein
MTLVKVKARATKTLIVQASPTILTYDHQNIFMTQATGFITGKMAVTIQGTIL